MKLAFFCLVLLSVNFAHADEPQIFSATAVQASCAEAEIEARVEAFGKCGAAAGGLVTKCKLIEKKKNKTQEAYTVEHWGLGQMLMGGAGGPEIRTKYRSKCEVVIQVALPAPSGNP